MKYVAVTACAILSALLGCDVEVKVGVGDEGGSFEVRTSETESPLDDSGAKK
jgi:hypothetical protein